MSYSMTVGTASPARARLYWMTLGIVLAIGFAINYWMVASIPTETIMAINPWVILIGYFVCAFVGIGLSKTSDNPLVSFIGYLMVVVPVGVVITPYVQGFDPAVVKKAVMFTAVLSGIMGCAGMLFPQFFRSIGGVCVTALIAAIIAEIVLMIMGYDLAIMDWIVAIIFLGLIGYDFAMALDDDATIDAAVDRAVALYLDIINLFIRILAIFGDGD